MYKKDFYYNLPEELIAKTPFYPRDECRLMVVDRKTQKIEDKIFKEILYYLKKGDVIVLNDTRVYPVRVLLYRRTGMILDAVFIRENGKWKILAKKMGRLKNQEILFTQDGKKAVKVCKKGENIYIDPFLPIEELFEKYGRAPLPPYIKRAPEEKDKEDYQTVYAKKGLSVAAPTAGLHFTDKLLKEIEKIGVKVVYITLNIGEPTFKPIEKEKIEEHEMGEEEYEIEESACKEIESAKRVIAVGTSVVRALEDCVKKYKKLVPIREKASIFIYPGFKFEVVDVLLTNLHQPESPPLILTASFAGRELLLKAYKRAVEKGYRFLSYGDAMLIL